MVSCIGLKVRRSNFCYCWYLCFLKTCIKHLYYIKCCVSSPHDYLFIEQFKILYQDLFLSQGWSRQIFIWFTLSAIFPFKDLSIPSSRVYSLWNGNFSVFFSPRAGLLSIHHSLHLCFRLFIYQQIFIECLIGASHHQVLTTSQYFYFSQNGTLFCILYFSV